MKCATRFLALCAVALVTVTGCKPNGKVRTPDDYLPYVSMALEAAGTASSIGQTEAKVKGAFSACVTTGALEAAFITASDAVVGVSTKQEEIPAVEVDVSDCLEYAKDEPKGKDLSKEVKELIDVWAGTAIRQAQFFVDKLKTTNCKGYQGGTAALTYVEQALGPIVEEVSDPDGKLSLPAVPLNLAACEE